jgi:putative ABC transport system substrate-binding protein
MFSLYMMRWICSCIICLSALFTLSIPEAYSAEAVPVAVVYPEIGKPYQDVIDSIIQGIRQQYGASVELFALKGGTEDANLNPWLVQRRIKVVIALAKQGLEATEKLPNGLQRILGALLSPPPQNGSSYAGGISLVPDPEIIFKKVLELSPKTKRVIAVYDPASNDWLIRLAKPEALKLELELLALPAKDLRDAAATYNHLLERGIGKTDLVWLLNDPNTIDQQTILPLLLQRSWDNGFTVISNNPSHVKRGVLFALYPDYAGMGASLGRMAAEVAGSSEQLPVSTLKDVLIAVNLRTAEHLNLAFSQKEKEAFDLIFPESR